MDPDLTPPAPPASSPRWGVSPTVVIVGVTCVVIVILYQRYMSRMTAAVEAHQATEAAHRAEAPPPSPPAASQPPEPAPVPLVPNGNGEGTTPHMRYVQPEPVHIDQGRDTEGDSHPAPTPPGPIGEPEPPETA